MNRSEAFKNDDMFLISSSGKEHNVVGNKTNYIYYSGTLSECRKQVTMLETLKKKSTQQ